jgi:signal-transduction protein with cAMP-binding, CBS, and nucleotidyltransferase domain
VEKGAVDRICSFLDAGRIAGEDEIFKEVKTILHSEKNILKLLSGHISKINLPQGFVRERVLLGSKQLAERLNLIEVLEVIVSGVRFLSLFHQVEKTNTFERLNILAEKGILTKEMVIELKEIYNFLNNFRIKLRSEWLNPNILSNQEKILFEECFWSLRRFKELLPSFPQPPLEVYRLLLLL